MNMTLREDLERVMKAFPRDFQELEAGRIIRDHGQALMEAVDAKRAIEEQAMVTECVSVDGRDPSDVIRDIISWHFEMDGCRKDAERYRWLKENHTQKWFDKESRDPVSVEFDFEGDGHDIDAAIDAAMEGEG